MVNPDLCSPCLVLVVDDIQPTMLVSSQLAASRYRNVRESGLVVAKLSINRSTPHGGGGGEVIL